MDIISIINKHKNKVLNILVIFVALIIALNIYKGQVKAIKSLENQKDMETKKNEILGTLSGLEKNINSYKDFFTKKDISSLVNMLTNIAAESNIKVIAIKPLKEQNYAAYVKYPFDLVISAASYHQLGKFISKIESFPEVFYTVESMNMRSISEKAKIEQGERISAGLVVSTVFYKD
jgi:Tfp pilus assembly protein PilO